MTYIICFALINQATQQAFGVIPHISGSVTKYCVRIIAVIQDSCTFNIKRQRVLEPKMVVWVLPSVRRVPVESMERDDTE